ncbi:MAG: DNA polymerase IV [Deltaproteobacteria bacterium]|nr:DNA polymerase IV [Deltaproteobacteria bacterium]
MEKRVVMHVDMDAFFASVELKKRPELRGRPLIVGGAGDPARRGVVSAASYEARKFGIRSGMPLRTAARLCPEAVFLPVDFEAYEGESERFMAMLRGYTDLVESFGLDEAFLELRVKEGEDAFKKSLDCARDIKKRVREEMGLTCSVGVGPNKLIAKLASDMKKPDGFSVIKEKDVEKTLRDMPARKLWGVGEKTERRLKFLGIKTIGEIAKTPLRHLERNFGPSFGRMLHEHSRGMDASPVVPFFEPNSFSREITFEEDTNDVYFIKETLYELTKDLTGRLKDEGYKGRTVTIKVRYADFQTITRSHTFEDTTDSMNDIWSSAAELFGRVDLARKVRLVGVRVANLEKWKGAGLAGQPAVLDGPPAGPAGVAKQ